MPYLRLLGAQLAIGAAAIFARFALSGAGPYAVSALRLVLAAAIMLALALPLQRLAIRRELALACAGAALAVHFATWIASLLYTSVAVSTVFVTTTPLWTEAYEAVRRRRTPTSGFALALALAFSGVTFIVFARGSAAAPVPGRAVFGDALALIGSVAIGAYLIIVRDAGAFRGTRLGTRQIVARTYAWAAFALLITALIARQPPPAGDNVRAWFGILAMALVSQLLGHTALNAALRHFSPSTIALTTLLEPAIAAVLAALLFRETLSLQTIAGGVLVLAAVAATLISERRRARELYDA